MEGTTTIEGIEFPLSLRPEDAGKDLWPWEAEADGSRVYKTWRMPDSLFADLARCTITPRPEGGWELIVTDYSQPTISKYDMRPVATATLSAAMMIAGERVAELRRALYERELRELKGQLMQRTDALGVAERCLGRVQRALVGENSPLAALLRRLLSERSNEFSLVIVDWNGSGPRAVRRLHTGTEEEIDEFVSQSGGMTELTAQLDFNQELHRLPAARWNHVSGLRRPQHL